MPTLNPLSIARSVDPRIEILTPTTDTDLTLPSTGVMAGQRVIVINNGANSGNFPRVFIKDTVGTTVRTVYPQTTGEVVATQNNPTTTAHWAGVGPVLSNWMNITVSQYGLGNSTAFTNTTTTEARMRRNGDTADLEILFTFTGTPGGGAGAFIVEVPSLALDTTKWNNAVLRGAGRAFFNGNSPFGFFLDIYNTSGKLTFQAKRLDSNVNGFQPAASFPESVSSGEYYSVSASGVPISGWSVTKG